MTTHTLIRWHKIPSVTRPNKFFYRAQISGAWFTVKENWATKLWTHDLNPEKPESFSSSQLAREAAERKALGL